jgi:hypothetical protein
MKTSATLLVTFHTFAAAGGSEDRTGTPALTLAGNTIAGENSCDPL